MTASQSLPTRPTTDADRKLIRQAHTQTLLRDVTAMAQDIGRINTRRKRGLKTGSMSAFEAMADVNATLTLSPWNFASATQPEHYHSKGRQTGNPGRMPAEYPRHAALHPKVFDKLVKMAKRHDYALMLKVYDHKDREIPLKSLAGVERRRMRKFRSNKHGDGLIRRIDITVRPTRSFSSTDTNVHAVLQQLAKPHDALARKRAKAAAKTGAGKKRNAPAPGA